MTGLYVASNVQSLTSQIQLQRSMHMLGDVLTRLSTGLRINSGKDDPAGLIASELLKSDITGTNMAIRNTQRANSILAIADTALGQVSNLLNDIKALVVEAANTGAMNAQQIAANQLQVDASIDSIDRISKTTNFQGDLLLDGSYDFETYGVDRSALPSLNIYQANFGTQSKIDITVDIMQDARRAQLIYDKAGVSMQTVLEVTGNRGNDVFKFEAGTTVDQMAKAINLVSDSTGVRAVVGSEATYGQIMLTSAGTDNDINLTARMPGTAAGDWTVRYSAGNSTETTYTITEPQAGRPGIIDFQLKMEERTAPSIIGLDESFNGLYTYDITGDDGGGIVVQSSKGVKINKVEFIETDEASATNAEGVAARFDEKAGFLQIHYSPAATDDGLRRAINSIDGLRLISGGEADLPGSGIFSPTDLRDNNGLDIKATVPGSKFNNTDVVYVFDEDFAVYGGPTVGDVALSYFDGPQYAAATIRWGDGTDTATATDPSEYDVQMRIIAKQTGADLNDVKIHFEQDNTFDPGQVTAIYDAKNKLLHVRGQIDNADDSLNATYGALKAAIEECSPFRVDITTMDFEDPEDPSTAGPLNGKPYPLSQKIHTGLIDDPDVSGTTPNTAESSFIKTGQLYGDIGTDHQTLFVIIGSDDVTANDVIAAFNDTEDAPFAKIAANFTVSNTPGSTGEGLIFNLDYDNMDGSIDGIPAILTRIFSAALTGGNDGWTTDVTAKELVDFINNDEVLSQLFQADLGFKQFGNGKLTLFDEAAYYGSPWNETGLQFLGPKDSPDVMFITDGPNSQLGISFVDSQNFECVSDDRPIASLSATYPNAAFTVQSIRGGDEFDNMAVRLIRLDKNHEVEIDDDTGAVLRDDSYAKYISGPSTSMAYCNINELNTGDVEEYGKFIVYSVQGGDQFNNVSIVARWDEHQTEEVTARYDESKKQLVITVSDPTIELTQAIAAINETGIFRAEYDFSFNRGPGDTGPGIDTFEDFFAGRKEGEIGNTGNTGGYNGVLEVYVAGDDTQITAQRVVDAINKDPITSRLFYANRLNTPEADDPNQGFIDFRADNIKTTTDPSGKPTTVPGLITGVPGRQGNDVGYMLVHLATDQFGNSITTAKDLVALFEMLTPEQTRGISVSLIRPDGVDNLNRIWSVDNCGNVMFTEICEDDFGKGILQPTIEYDDCDNPILHPIEFWSFGENMTDGFARGSIVAVNGKDAALEIYARKAGPEFNGVSFKYVTLTDPLEKMYTEYDAARREIIAYIQPGTTAAGVKNLIESSEQTRDLFRAELLGDGTGEVRNQDNFLIMAGGLYDAGYRGGARMLGATDADPHRLTLESIEEGAAQKVIVRTLEGEMAFKNAAGFTMEVDYGADIVANLNGIAMVGYGRDISLDTSMLKLDMTVADKVTTGDQIHFSITGGGATFQIGPSVVSNQQVRIGIQSVNSARLGSAAGRLYMLRSGGVADLATDTKLADRIVQDSILAIAQLRGRLGAIQRSTLDPAIVSLQESVVQLSAAESAISNADFAEESSKLTRAQILVQAGARTLAVANQFPQYAASLIG